MLREAWLTKLVGKLKPLFKKAGLTIPEVRVSCSWPVGQPRKVAGQHWNGRAATDGVSQICITPRYADGPDVAEVMVHELVHACLPDAKHGKLFKQAMSSLGLEGKATTTFAGEDLLATLWKICEEIGEYPHAALSIEASTVKKQTTRLLKLTCDSCGYTLRTTQKWIDVGLPTCCCSGEISQEEK